MANIMTIEKFTKKVKEKFEDASEEMKEFLSGQGSFGQKAKILELMYLGEIAESLQIIAENSKKA